MKQQSFVGVYNSVTAAQSTSLDSTQTRLKVYGLIADSTLGFI